MDSPSNTFIIYKTDEYRNKLSENDFNKIKTMFCIQGLTKTKIICSHMRPLCLTKEFAKSINTGQDITDKNLIGIKVGIVRRPKDENGNKIDGKLIVQEGVIEGVYNYNSNKHTSIKIKGELIRADRVFGLNKV